MKKNEDKPVTLEQAAANLEQLYPTQVIDHWLQPRNLGKLKRSDGHAGGQGPCGDSIWMWIQVTDNKGDEIISRATFISDVCIGAVSCSSALTEMITGMEVRQAMQISPDILRKTLGGLTEEKSHCADLAIKTLKDTIRSYHQGRAAGWKLLYQS
ncbi:MAG: iron-sulfur cluster assembly scaffold protein [Pseudomonadota bacterium]|nr:iron-sulfur cluster assembly scaffold protein [Pseudomonadota bacterium]MEA3240949.1 iron-sulfur cluster assembly scaffold protein [Pseudomonadota bacterium]